MEVYVLDASALLIYFGFDPRQAALTVEKLLTSALKGESGILLVMSRINWGEVYNATWRARGQAAAEETVDSIDRLPIRIIDADRDATRLAVGLVRTFGLHYTDSFAAALAQQYAASLATADDLSVPTSFRYTCS